MSDDADVVDTRCDEQGCGHSVIGSSLSEVNGLVRDSDIEGAGLGLHASNNMGILGESASVQCVYGDVS